MLGTDNTYSTTLVPAPPHGGADLGAYDGANVADRLGYDDVGSSAAGNDLTGTLADQGTPFGVAPMAAQGGADAKQARLTGGAGAPSIVGLDAPGFSAAARAGQQVNNHGITLARAGAPTDAGRLPVAIGRPASSPDLWCQLDDGMGMKRESAPPLAYSGIVRDTVPAGGISSPGGSMPISPATDPVQLNTYRVPPTPWDTGNYIGGPLDG